MTTDPMTLPEPTTITRPGIYDLTSEQYHNPAITGEWMSNSDGRELTKMAPAQFKYNRDHGIRKTSDAFDLGHLAHTRLLGKGEQFHVFDTPKLDGRTAGGKAQAREATDARAEGLIPVYADQWDQVTAMIDAINDDPEAHALLRQPGRRETCLFWREQITVDGNPVTVQRRAMIDLIPDMPDNPRAPIEIVDYKTAADATPSEDMRKKIFDYGYHRQLSTYRAAIRALFGRHAEVTFVFQDTRPPYLPAIIELDTPAQMIGDHQNGEALEIWARCQTSGVWPGHTRTTLGVPAWIERQYEEEIF